MLESRFTDPVPEFQLTSQVLHVVFLVRPLLLALGMLSPLDALLLWGMEQALVFGLGCSPMSSNLRLLGMFAISACVTVCTFFILSTVGVVVFSMAMGFLLSLDLRQFGAHCRGGPRVTRGDSGWRRGASSATPCWFGWQLCCREMLLYLGLLPGAMAEAGLLHHFLSPFQNLARGPQAAVSYLILFIVCWALGEIQGAYVFGGVFLNPLYPRGMANVPVFKQRRRGLPVAGAIRRVLLNLMSPFAMIALLMLDGSVQQLHTASLSVGFTRAFRMVWQSFEDALFQMVSVRLAAGETRLPGWDSMGIGVQLLLVGLLSDRLLQFLSKLKFALTLLVTWTEASVGREPPGPERFPVSSAALCGVPVCHDLCSSAAPLHPAHLPLGFPRPQHSWVGPMGTACLCPDSMVVVKCIYKEEGESMML